MAFNVVVRYTASHGPRILCRNQFVPYTSTCPLECLLKYSRSTTTCLNREKLIPKQYLRYPPHLLIRHTSNQPNRSLLADLGSSPRPALVLGIAGAIPFTHLAILSLAAPEYMQVIVQAQCAYGASILSFIGAVHWGFALSNPVRLQPDWGTLGYSVTPSLVAWLALLMKPGSGLVTLSIGLLYAFARDMNTKCFPVWYYALRKVLTTLAVSSVLITTGAYCLN